MNDSQLLYVEEDCEGQGQNEAKMKALLLNHLCTNWIIQTAF